jgi:hypothetical protein
MQAWQCIAHVGKTGSSALWRRPRDSGDLAGEKLSEGGCQPNIGARAVLTVMDICPRNKTEMLEEVCCTASTAGGKLVDHAAE